MDYDTVSKIEQALKSVKSIGLVLPERLGVDIYCSALALREKLQIMDKRVVIVSSAKNLPNLNYFSSVAKISHQLTAGNDLVIKVGSNNSVPKQIRYEKENSDLLIYVTPDRGSFSEADVEVLPSAQGLELLLFLGVASMEKIGSLHSANTELFFNTPKIVINNQLDQEYFGSINWVDSTASSVSEQIAGWLLKEDPLKSNDTVITGLLAGIIDSTQSFRDPKTTPHTLAVAAELVSAGARRQDVIQHLFKTKSFSLLQLWGRALARIKTGPDENLLYTLITEQDFLKTETSASLLPQVLQELSVMASKYQLIVLAAKVPQGTEVYLAAKPHIKLRQLARRLDGSKETNLEPLNSHYYLVRLLLENTSLEEAEKQISALQPTSV